jgi:hypothetical protein
MSIFAIIFLAGKFTSSATSIIPGYPLLSMFIHQLTGPPNDYYTAEICKHNT